MNSINRQSAKFSPKYANTGHIYGNSETTEYCHTLLCINFPKNASKFEIYFFKFLFFPFAFPLSL